MTARSPSLDTWLSSKSKYVNAGIATTACANASAPTSPMLFSPKFKNSKSTHSVNASANEHAPRSPILFPNSARCLSVGLNDRERAPTPTSPMLFLPRTNISRLSQLGKEQAMARAPPTPRSQSYRLSFIRLPQCGRASASACAPLSLNLWWSNTNLATSHCGNSSLNRFPLSGPGAADSHSEISSLRRIISCFRHVCSNSSALLESNSSWREANARFLSANSVLRAATSSVLSRSSLFTDES
mmetsp:Transcript_36489/g.97142  ORF Transcript_36489/g.97142 Transcript_36489/m.97142 type:complete len:243 (+) Transcript_36489:504-1232(+)